MRQTITDLEIYSGNTNLFQQGAQYIIPLYQRSFAWGQKEIVQLIEDISDIQKEQPVPYYLGTLIVSRKSGNENEYIYEVIDGQQRLTALCLLFHVLCMSTGNTLSFACREKSNYTLKNLDDIMQAAENPIDQTEIDEEVDEKIDESLWAGVRIIQNEVQKTDFNSNEFREKLKKVHIYRIEVPEHTDLNRYFEVMNTRGEQLEQHDILKARLMEKLSDKEQAVFARIWDACSDMTGYVQMHFQTNERVMLFGRDWQDLPQSDILDKVDITTQEDEKGFSICELTDQTSPTECRENSDEDDDYTGFKSIIDFPHFLLHVLRVLVESHKITSRDPKVRLVDDLLDDKKLVSAFSRVIKNGMKDGKPIDPHQFAHDFIICLLRTRYLFDKYIIKRKSTKDNSDAKWNLKELTFSKRKNGRAGYDPIDTAFKVPYEWNQDQRSKERHKINVKLQSCLRVSYISPKSMYWLTELLCWLYRDSCVHLNQLDDYQNITENIARKAVRDQFLDGDQFQQGVNTPHIVFNYLDYLLWYDDCIDKPKQEPGHKTKYHDFVFESTTSVEHWYPQHPSKGSFEKWADVDTFGNLCLVSSSVNSRFSNMSPLGKKSTFRKETTQGSLKLREMADATETENDIQQWKDKGCKEHGERMIEILKNACQTDAKE